MMMSIDASCKASAKTNTDPREILETLQKSYQAVSEVAVDAKLTKLQQVGIGAKEAVMKYTNKIDNLVNDLSAGGHILSALEKKRALLRGLRE